MIRLLALLGFLAGHASAETAVVYSGEHAEFTRLVIELPATADWTVGRTDTGYAFAAVTKAQPQYDTSRVWNRIPTTRLQALELDAVTGALRLTLACDCHVFPFEYQPGVIVLDIKPGPAPAESVFEMAFSPAPTAGPTASAAAPGYDWLDLDPALSGSALAAVDLTLPTGTVSLDPLREDLLLEISRGAARGVVDMVLPGNAPVTEPELVTGEPLPWSQIHIGPPPETTVADLADGKDSRQPEGEACVPDTLLAIADWGDARRPLDLLSEARSGLYGEFDTLDSEATRRAVKLHLYLGFGAEAAQYADLLATATRDEEASLFRSMALMVDGHADPGSPFIDMLACDGAAALWAALANDPFPPGVEVNSAAIARSFLALPAHLRQALGEPLAEKLLAVDAVDAARIVRDAVGRSPDVAPASVERLDAQADLHSGQADAALSHAEAAIAHDGTNAKAWIALVEAHFRKLEPLPPDSAEALRAFAGEQEGTADAAEFFRALALAEVLSGQVSAGFAVAEDNNLPRADLWHATAALAEDDSFLRHAITTEPDAVGPEVAKAVAARLAGLGFPDAALAWLNPTGPKDDPARRRIVAAAEFARGDARQSLAMLQGLTEPEDEALRARALAQLGRISEAREAYVAADLPEEALRLAAWEGSWAELAGAEAQPWAPVLAQSGPPSPESAGPLARGAASIDASATARASIGALLAEIGVPES